MLLSLKSLMYFSVHCLNLHWLMAYPAINKNKIRSLFMKSINFMNYTTLTKYTYMKSKHFK